MYRENVNPSWVPQVGQKFRNLDDAWSFWVNYGGRAGFEVRKRCTNESKFDGKVTSCRYVCQGGFSSTRQERSQHKESSSKNKNRLPGSYDSYIKSNCREL